MLVCRWLCKGFPQKTVAFWSMVEPLSNALYLKGAT